MNFVTHPLSVRLAEVTSTDYRGDAPLSKNVPEQQSIGGRFSV